jgi:hypothetical protein
VGLSDSDNVEEGGKREGKKEREKRRRPTRALWMEEGWKIYPGAASSNYLTTINRLATTYSSVVAWITDSYLLDSTTIRMQGTFTLRGAKPFYLTNK